MSQKKLKVRCSSNPSLSITSDKIEGSQQQGLPAGNLASSRPRSNSSGRRIVSEVHPDRAMVKAMSLRRIPSDSQVGPAQTQTQTQTRPYPGSPNGKDRYHKNQTVHSAITVSSDKNSSGTGKVLGGLGGADIDRTDEPSMDMSKEAAVVNTQSNKKSDTNSNNKEPNRFSGLSSNQRACLRHIFTCIIICFKKKRRVTGECGRVEKY